MQKEIQFFFFIRPQGNKAYLLQMPSGKVPVYCHMSEHGLGACGGGGWTLVIKTDGSKVSRDKPTVCLYVGIWTSIFIYNRRSRICVLYLHELYEIFESLSLMF